MPTDSIPSDLYRCTPILQIFHGGVSHEVYASGRTELLLQAQAASDTVSDVARDAAKGLGVCLVVEAEYV
jgi:hypothetical protein